MRLPQNTQSSRGGNRRVLYHPQNNYSGGSSISIEDAASRLVKSHQRSASPQQTLLYPSGDSNVASLFPGVRASDSFERMEAVAARRKPHHHQPALVATRNNSSMDSGMSSIAMDATDQHELPDPALQFVPSFEESNPSDGAGTSWDVLLEEKKEDNAAAPALSDVSSLASRARDYNRQFRSSSRSRADGRASSRGRALPDEEETHKQLQQQAHGNNKRMARLAALFSSRAETPPSARQNYSHTTASTTAPGSPGARSGSSTGCRSGGSSTHKSSDYVGWPGTQDKRGATVAVQSSYDDSSVGPVSAPLPQFPDKSEAAPSCTPWPSNSQRSRRRNEEVTTTTTSTENDDQNAADYHLAAVVADARAITSRSYAKSDVGGWSSRNPKVAPNRLGARHWLQHKNKYTTTTVRASPYSSSDSDSASKTSSAYLDSAQMARLVYPSLGGNSDSNNDTAAATDYGPQQPRPPTAEYLAVNDQLQPPHRSFSAAAVGYRGLIEKTQDVPSLMDNVLDSDSMASSARASSTSRQQHARRSGGAVDSDQSDVFDGLSVARESDVFDNIIMEAPTAGSYPERIAEEEEQHDGAAPAFQVVHLAGGLTAIQSTQTRYSNRRTASDFDENLTNSDVDPNGFHHIPGFNEMVTSGTRRDSSLHGIQGNFGTLPAERARNVSMDDEDLTTSDSSLFTDPYEHSDFYSSFLAEGDLSEYRVDNRDMKKLVRRYRALSDNINTQMTLDEFEREEDEHKAFALFEMRSRVMEKDIERGLERRGGTLVVDDMVTTAYYRAAMRVRDAVIVSKAWRDGASPMDVVNSSLLTRRADHRYFIKRPALDRSMMNDSRLSGYSGSSVAQRYEWEQVGWVDDTDFQQYRCPSLGPRHMRGFEMFTVGDCQSILLKLTNEHCINLRSELDDATRRQIEAEDLLRIEGDGSNGTDGDSMMMTEAEMSYLSAMEEVKTISKKLVAAEQTFALVRDRIQELVTRYQELLVKIETESFTGASSVITYESSYYSDSEVWEERENRERAAWARRAKRAEVRAELAAREALMAKQEARMIQEQKQRELEALQHKLDELQSESSAANTEKEMSAAIARSFASPQPEPLPPPQPTTSGAAAAAAAADNISEAVSRSRGIDKERIDGVKQRFRDRIAAKKRQVAVPVTPAAPTPVEQVRSSPRRQYHKPVATNGSPPTARNLFRSAGQEMFQQMDFYERSLRAVELTREPTN